MYGIIMIRGGDLIISVISSLGGAGSYMLAVWLEQPLPYQPSTLTAEHSAPSGMDFGVGQNWNRPIGCEVLSWS